MDVCGTYKAKQSKAVSNTRYGWISETFLELLCLHVVIVGFVEAVGIQACRDYIVNWLLI